VGRWFPLPAPTALPVGNIPAFLAKACFRVVHLSAMCLLNHDIMLMLIMPLLHCQACEALGLGQSSTAGAGGDAGSIGQAKDAGKPQNASGTGSLSMDQLIAAEVAELKDKTKKRYKWHDTGVRGTFFVVFPAEPGACTVQGGVGAVVALLAL